MHVIDLSCIFVSTKRKRRDVLTQLDMIKTLSNGYTYEVVQNFLGGYNLYYKGAGMSDFKRSTRSFRSLEEAEEWFETMEADYIAQRNRPATAPLDCSRYYAEAPRGTYFGD